MTEIIVYNGSKGQTSRKIPTWGIYPQGKFHLDDDGDDDNDDDLRVGKSIWLEGQTHNQDGFTRTQF